MSECDQVIFSGGETSGTVTSPYYPRPYPLNVQCIYYIDGLHDKQNLEKVRVTVTDIDIGVARRPGQRSVNHSYTRPYIKRLMISQFTVPPSSRARSGLISFRTRGML